MSWSDDGRSDLRPVYIPSVEMYCLPMSVVSVADARNNLSDVITRSQSEAVFIERRGQPQ